MLIVHTKNIMNFPTILHQIPCIELDTPQDDMRSRTFVDNPNGGDVLLNLKWLNNQGITFTDFVYECNLQNFLARCLLLSNDGHLCFAQCHGCASTAAGSCVITIIGIERSYPCTRTCASILA